MINLNLYSEDIINSYNNGIGAYTLAKKYNVYEQRIYTFLKQNNIKIRGKKQLGINLNYFNNIDSNKKAYILGFIAADGSIVKTDSKIYSSYQLSISLNNKDISILEMIKEELEAESIIRDIGRNQVRFITAKKEIIADLFKYGIEPKKSLTMKNIIPLIPKEFRYAYIRGYFDGDGSIFTANIGGKYPHQQKYVSIRGTKEFLQGILDELSFDCNISFSNGTHMLRFGNKKYIQEFKEYIYTNSEFHLKRKYEKFD